MSLCINDTVSVEEKGERRFYRVQKFQREGEILWLRLHSAATLDNNEEKLSRTISILMTKYKLQKESINSLGFSLTNTI